MENIMTTAFTIKLPRAKNRCFLLAKGPIKTMVQSSKGKKAYSRKDKSWRNE